MELALAPLDNSLPCFSYGSGTKDASNLGVIYKTSSPNLEGEQVLDPRDGTLTRKSKRNIGAMRRSTRAGKENGVTHLNHKKFRFLYEIFEDWAVKLHCNTSNR